MPESELSNTPAAPGPAGAPAETGALESDAGDMPGVTVALGALPAGALVTEAGLAEMLHLDKRTIRRMVQRGELPPAVRFGGHATWLAGKIIAHFEARAERAERTQEKRLRDFRESA
jgi:predicted DNA-binding transcriptional regulator AlpA